MHDIKSELERLNQELIQFRNTYGVKPALALELMKVERLTAIARAISDCNQNLEALGHKADRNSHELRQLLDFLENAET